MLRKLVIMLSLSTAVLAVTSAYLAFELHRSREQMAATAANDGATAGVDFENDATLPSAAGSTADAAASGSARTPEMGGANAVAGASSTAQSPSASTRMDPKREAMLPFARQFLVQYDDPAQRANLSRQARSGIAAEYSRLKEKLKLSEQTFDQLIGLLADEGVEQQEHYFRCFVNPACDLTTLPATVDHTQEYLALLGNEKFDAFTKYRASMNDWQTVVQLRGRLSDSNYLRDGDADRLLEVLAAEAERIQTEARTTGASLHGFINGSGSLWYTSEGAAEQQLAAARQYSQRMRAQAATVLNGDQLRAYAQLQDEALDGLAALLRDNGK